MASSAQIHANRLNAQSSTGPRSEDGKAVSRFNALKYGIEARSLVIPGEDPDQLEALACEYLRQFQPQGPLEAFLVETLIQSDWNRSRYARIEAKILQDSPDAVSGKPAQTIARRVAAAERSYFRALKELRRAQKERRAELAIEDAAVASGLYSPIPQPPIGFVPSVSPQVPVTGLRRPVSPGRGRYWGF